LHAAGIEEREFPSTDSEDVTKPILLLADDQTQCIPEALGQMAHGAGLDGGAHIWHNLCGGSPTG